MLNKQAQDKRLVNVISDIGIPLASPVFLHQVDNGQSFKTGAEGFLIREATVSMQLSSYISLKEPLVKFHTARI